MFDTLAKRSIIKESAIDKILICIGCVLFMSCLLSIYGIADFIFNIDVPKIGHRFGPYWSVWINGIAARGISYFILGYFVEKIRDFTVRDNINIKNYTLLITISYLIISIFTSFSLLPQVFWRVMCVPFCLCIFIQILNTNINSRFSRWDEYCRLCSLYIFFIHPLVIDVFTKYLESKKYNCNSLTSFGVVFLFSLLFANVLYAIKNILSISKHT